MFHLDSCEDRYHRLTLAPSNTYIVVACSVLKRRPFGMNTAADFTEERTKRVNQFYA